MRLSFGKSFKTSFFVAEGNEKEINKAMVDYLDQIGFKSYYMRCWKSNGVEYVDFGSHTNFFFITD